MKSRAQLKTIEIANFDTLPKVSQRIYGTPDYGWVIALVNDGLTVFGAHASQATFSELLKGKVVNGKIYVPNNIDDITSIFVESIHQFGIKRAVSNILFALRVPGDNEPFFAAVHDSFDANATFSFRALNTRLSGVYPAYRALLDNASKNIAPPAAVTLFQYEDISDFTNTANLTLFILQLNSTFMNVVYAGHVNYG